MNATRLVAAACLGLAACGQDPTEEREYAGAEALKDYAMVEITLRPHLEGDSVVVRGTANLPDDAFITFRVLRMDPDEEGMDTLAVGQTRMTGGRFRKLVDVKNAPPGELVVWAAFQTVTDPPQPPEVIARYGPRGERMKGPDVEDAEGLRRAVRKQQITWRGDA